MRVLQIALAFAVSASALVFQNPPTQQPAPADTQKVPEALEHWRRATVSLGQIIIEGNVRRFITVGSGVIVALDAQHGCILTAKHVIYNPKDGYIPSETYLRLPQDEPQTEPDLGVRVVLRIGTINTWKSLPDDSDLAIIPIPDVSKYKNIHAVGIQDFGTDDDVFQGAPILILGYPEILGDAYQTTPIARGGIVAWTDPNGRLDKPFLVDANVFNGNSGGPVFHVRTGINRYGTMQIGGGFAFIGIVTKDAYEQAPVHVGTQNIGQIDPTTGRPAPVEAKVLNIGGIGVVEPVSKARTLVQTFVIIPPKPK